MSFRNTFDRRRRGVDGGELHDLREGPLSGLVGGGDPEAVAALLAQLVDLVAHARPGVDRLEPEREIYE